MAQSSRSSYRNEEKDYKNLFQKPKYIKYMNHKKYKSTVNSRFIYLYLIFLWLDSVKTPKFVVNNINSTKVTNIPVLALTENVNLGKS